MMSLLLLLFVIGVGGVYASSQYAISNIDTGVVNIEIDEYTLNEEGEEIPWVDEVGVTPGMVVSKIPYFTATGNDCYIRATMTVNGLAEGATPINFENFQGISEDWIKIGDYYYYKYPLKTNESIDFFHSFVIPNDWNDDVNPSNIGDWGFSIDVTVDAIQSDNFSPNFESESPWGSIDIKESIHKDDYDINVFTASSKTDLSIVVEDNSNIVVKPSDFFEGFKTMVPGDILVDSVEINSDKHCKLYFATESLSDIDLLQKLKLQIIITKDDKDTLIYEGSLDSKINKTLLGEFEKGEKGELKFAISMPEELDNEYTLRNASVKWVFKVENISEGPDTGDNSHMALYAGIMAVSGFFIIVLSTNLLKKRRDDASEE